MSSKIESDLSVEESKSESKSELKGFDETESELS